jgi:hypothetical protein
MAVFTRTAAPQRQGRRRAALVDTRTMTIGGYSNYEYSVIEYIHGKEGKSKLL